MSMLEHTQWRLRERAERIRLMREILSTPWKSDQRWEGKTIGLHLPTEIRSKLLEIQERLGLKSYKEAIFKALVIGIRALDEIPKEIPDARSRFRGQMAAMPEKPKKAIDPDDDADDADLADVDLV